MCAFMAWHETLRQEFRGEAVIKYTWHSPIVNSGHVNM